MGHIEALLKEIAELEDRVHNLNLFLDYLREVVVSPDDWSKFEEKFSGLAGYNNSDLWEQEE